ncbi:unnamed protein product [Cuscuta epithymum]|uniref:very-long-chain (3R)-3-hydroxyacyl-CoA dehydratase n=1 Tax=Cuscuta epithymum TaxID=186058 RepID=A0AAV0G879_9ASTE|nr:unnamed protein product [Cuscuta epithymum]CAH9143567.1 unnamed protein product [Cuscuta epithymum]
MSAQVRSSYLFLYNSIQAIGWAVSLWRISNRLASTKSFNGAYASAGELICFLQRLAFLEVVHGALGIFWSCFLSF